MTEGMLVIEKNGTVALFRTRTVKRGRLRRLTWGSPVPNTLVYYDRPEELVAQYTVFDTDGGLLDEIAIQALPKDIAMPVQFRETKRFVIRTPDGEYVRHYEACQNGDIVDLTDDPEDAQEYTSEDEAQEDLRALRNKFMESWCEQKQQEE